MEIKMPGLSLGRKDESEAAYQQREEDGSGLAERKKGPPVLTGEDVFITLEAPDSDSHLQGMVKVATRKASLPFKKSYYSKTANVLGIYINSEDADKHSSIKLACDAYLRLGLVRSMKTGGRPLVLLGGDEGADGINLEVMVFSKGELIVVRENNLPPRDDIDYVDTLERLLYDLRVNHPGCIIEQCANLPRFESSDIATYHSTRIFKTLRTIHLKSENGFFRVFGTPLIVILFASLAYGYTIYSGFSKHNTLVQEVKLLEAQILQLSDSRLTIEVMEAREIFKHRESGEEKRFLDTITDVASAVSSMDGAEITSLRAPGNEPDVAAYLSIQLPRESSSSALMQARATLDKLVTYADGYSMRLSRTQGVSSQGGNVLFHIEVVNG